MCPVPTFTWQSTLTYPAHEVFAWHTLPGAFERLSPPWRTVRVLRSSGSLTPDSEVLVRCSALGPISFNWLLRHGEYRPQELFTDEQVTGPFRSWVHRHSFIPHRESLSTMLDEVEFEMPLLASPITSLIVRDLRRLFAFRHAVLSTDLLLHSRWSTQPRKRILIAGASGFIGSALAAFLTTAGHSVRRLVRRTPASSDEYFWDPRAREISPNALDDIDVVIHLGGESIVSGRWNAERKARLAASRVESTQFLADALSFKNSKPSLMIVASGVGFYGDTGNDSPDETSPQGRGFLAHLAGEWEKAASWASEHGVRVVNLRIGTVLNSRGGALGKMLPAFRAGLGGRLGSGFQRMGWIALEDLLGLIEHAMYTDSLSGPVNAVAPQVITNREFTSALGRRLKRPTWFSMPAPLLRIIFGELANEALLANSAATPTKALTSGYSFVFPDIDSALLFECP